MTPAEKMAAEKPPKKPKTNTEGVLICQLHKMRTDLGLTLDDVARQCGLTRQAIIVIEAGNGVRLLNAMALAKFFGTTVEKIWTLAE